MNWFRRDHCSINRRISAIRSWSLARPSGLATRARHSSGRNDIDVHSRTAASSCFSFSSPCADGMKSSRAPCEVLAGQIRRGPRVRAVRLAASTMLSMSAPESSRPASPAGTAPSARLDLVLPGHHLDHELDLGVVARAETAANEPRRGPCRFRSIGSRSGRLVKSIQSSLPR